MFQKYALAGNGVFAESVKQKERFACIVLLRLLGVAFLLVVGAEGDCKSYKEAVRRSTKRSYKFHSPCALIFGLALTGRAGQDVR